MEQQALASRVEQLQAADLSAALQALLKQAQSQLKPPSRSAAPAAPTAPATRQALVSGVLLLLERAAVLAAQQHDFKLIKDATSQLVAAFQQHGWLWELLLHKHLPDLLQHPAASQLFAKALGRLPGAAQARALHVWRQKLAAQPELAERVPLALVQLWLEQLGESFQARRITLPVMPGVPRLSAGAAGGAGTAAVGSGVAVNAAAGAAAEAEVHVVLREQLPHLLQLLLLLTCSVSAGGAGAAAATTAGGSAISGEREDAPCLSSMQSAATELRPPRGARQQQQRQGQATDSAAANSSASAGTVRGAGREGLSAAIGSSHMRDGVLRHAVLLISQLSNPDALHSMLGIQPRQQDQVAGSDSDGEQGQQGNGRQQPADASAAATEAGEEQAQQHVLSQREADRVRTAQALIEVCLDGLLTLQPLAAAVHDQLHTKGNSSGGGGTAAREAQHGSTVAASNAAAGSSAGCAALGEQDEQAVTALAELRHTAGLMLGLHRELTRLLHNQQRPGAAGLTAGGRRWQPGHLLSLAACPRLLDMLKTAHPAAGAGPGGNKGAGGGRRRSEVGCESSAEQGPLALLLVPPQLVPHGLELVRQAVEAASSKRGTQGSTGYTWCTELAERVAAIYASCYQAMWGAQVLQSAEAYQLLLPASHMRTLLRMAASGGCAAFTGAGDGEAEAAAEAALLAQNAVGIRQRRQRGTANELPGPGRATPGAAAATAAGGVPPAIRHKPDPNAAAGAGGGSSNSAVAELLQLFQPPASQNVQDQQQPHGEQPQHMQRRRIQAMPVRQEQHAEGEQQQQQQQPQGRERKRIVPQQLQPAPAATQVQKMQESAQQPATAEDAAGQPGQDGGGAAGYQRVIISRTDGMTDEEQGALWEAYIADKEFLLEMLGDSEYQQWYDEAAHPLRKQHRRPGGLEAAWAAVLGGPSGRSLVQLQLPRSLLEASGTMPWDAAAAACLRLLHALLDAVQRSASGSDSDADGQAAQRELLQRVFGPQQREAGAQAATRICHLSRVGQVQAAMKSARDLPAAGSGVLLAAQLLSLLKGEQYFGRQYGNRSERELLQRGLVQGLHNSSCGGRIVAPPLLAAYAQLLAALLPAARAEEEIAASSSGRAPQQRRLRVLLALLAQKLLLLPPPVQHLLGGSSAGPLLQLALPTDDEEQLPAEQAAALLWMLVQQQLACGARADGVQLPGDAPVWLECGAAGLLPCGERGKGHAVLLGPLPEARQAAAAELLSQLQQQVEHGLPPPEQQCSSGAAGALLSAENMLPAADACYAAIQLVLAEYEQQQGQQAEGGGVPGTGVADGEQEDEEGAPVPPLLLDSADAVAGLAAALCQAGAAAAAELASQLDAAAGQQQPMQQHGAADWTLAGEAAASQALCRQLLEAAVLLVDAGCLPPAAAQQLQAAIEALNVQLEAVQQLAVQLPGDHALVAAVLQAWEAAPTLWRAAAERHSSGSEAGSDDERSGRSGKSSQWQGEGGSRAGQSSGGGKRGGGEGQKRGRRRKRLRDVRNPAVRAMLAEDGGAGDLDASDLSDLEDFLVFNPERDYEAFFRRHFYHVREGDSDGEEAAALAEQDGAERQARQAPKQADRQADRQADKGKTRSSSKKAKRKRQEQE